MSDINTDDLTLPQSDTPEPTDAPSETTDVAADAPDLSTAPPADAPAEDAPAGADVAEDAPAADESPVEAPEPALADAPDAPSIEATDAAAPEAPDAPAEPSAPVDAPAEPPAPVDAPAEPSAPVDAPAEQEAGKSEAEDKPAEPAPAPAEAPVVDTASSSSPTIPTSIEGADAPGVVSGMTTSAPGVLPTVKVGEDHVAQGVDSQTIGAAKASAAAAGESLEAYLSAQGVDLGAAPGLVQHVAKKHGEGVTMARRVWSTIVKEFYCSETEESSDEG